MVISFSNIELNTSAEICGESGWSNLVNSLITRFFVDKDIVLQFLRYSDNSLFNFIKSETTVLNSKFEKCSVTDFTVWLSVLSNPSSLSVLVSFRLFSCKRLSQYLFKNLFVPSIPPSFHSTPTLGGAINKIYNLNASAPWVWKYDSGSTIFPFDLDILVPPKLIIPCENRFVNGSLKFK